ncbi:MAG: hypothetical protein GX190_03200 [Mollicutes bacterium]|nr:hypothetical protein [Mollicutes bacterium]
MKEEEVRLIDINLYGSIIFIFKIVISILLTYNDKLKLLNKKPLFNKENEKTITNISNFILLVIALVFVYTAYREYKINRTKGKINSTKVSFINLIVNEAQLILVIVITILPFIFPDDDEEQPNILIP